MLKFNNYKELWEVVFPAFKNEIRDFVHTKSTSSNIKQTIDKILEKVVFKETLKFLNERKVQFIIIAGPDKHKLKNVSNAPYLFKKISLEDVLKDREYISKFCHNDSKLLNYIYDKNSGILAGNRITTNGTHLMSAYFNSDYVNVNIIGERKSTPSKIGNYNNNIFVYGSCLTFGLFADDEQTFPSYLQKIINDSPYAGMVVHNLGVKGQNFVLNDLLYILDTPLREGDIVILVDKYSQDLYSMFHEMSIHWHDFSTYLNSTSIEAFDFLNSAFHCNNKIYNALAEYVFSLIDDKMKNNLQTKTHIKPYSYLEMTKKNQLIDSDCLIDKIFIKDLMTTIHNDRFEIKSNSIVGSIVMAANPFTWGHAKLIDLIVKECDYSYVFIIEDNHFAIPFIKRYEMVKKYIDQYSNCRIFATGQYFGADFLFPEYHEREKYENQKINNPVIDTMIFARHIAPTLGINRRYLGTEVNDPVTNQFNNYLSSILPQYGIEVRIIQRFCANDQNEEISGSKVRKLITTNPHSEKLKLYLPPTSIQVLTSNQ